MNVANTMASFFQDNVFRSDFAIAFSLSMPFLVRCQESDNVAALIYQADLFDENTVACIGYMEYRDGVKYTLHSVKAQKDAGMFGLVKKADVVVHSKQDFDDILSRLYQALEDIRAFAYSAPNALTDVQKKAVAEYTRLLRALTSDSLLGCFYAVSPLFFDWCCAVTINTSIEIGNGESDDEL